MRTVLAIGAALYAVRGNHERLNGHYSHAERRIRRGLALARRGGLLHSELGIRLLNSLGMICKYQGLFARSARAYRQALGIARKRLPAEHPLFATLYHNLAGLDHARGDYSSAEPLARNGLAIRVRALGAEHPDVGRDLAALGAILDGEKRQEEAERLYRRAIEIFERRGRSERRD